MLKSFGLSNLQVGLLNGIPFAVASVAMIWWGRHSDRGRERVWHTALPLGLSALALGSAVAATTVAPFIVILCLILVGTYALKGPFFALSSEWLAGTAAAAGLAQINALGNLAGFVDSFLIGAIQGATDSYALVLLPLVLIAAVGCVAVLCLAAGSVPARQRLFPHFTDLPMQVGAAGTEMMIQNGLNGAPDFLDRHLGG